MEEDNAGGNDEHKEEDEGEGRIRDPQDDAHHANNQRGHAKDVCENEEEDGVDKVHGADGDVERVGTLVHPWAAHASCYKRRGLDHNKSDRLHCSVSLGQSNKHALEHDIPQNGDNEVIC